MDTWKIESLLSDIVSELKALKSEARDIAKELNMYGTVTFAKEVKQKLSDIENSIDSLRR